MVEHTVLCHALSSLRSSALVSMLKYLDSCPAAVWMRKQCCRSSTFSLSFITLNMASYTL